MSPSAPVTPKLLAFSPEDKIRLKRRLTLNSSSLFKFMEERMTTSVKKS